MGDTWQSQIQRSGHLRRFEDLALIAKLGIRTVRYPILWEQFAPEQHQSIRWDWADQRLNGLRDLGIEPIVGLLHHGSGPAYTSLTHDGFPSGLAGYAAQVAERFPWVSRYTPINEPLTTARFSGLYGHWYPHGRDDRTFARALIHQCRATVLAMRAIRQVNSLAQLVQTDDLGTTHSTPRMKYQADFDNERRWLAWDLLCGRVTPHHALHGFLLNSGIQRAELSWFQDNPCPPDMVGINHYVTSDRFLDDDVSAYPANVAGANSRQPYADVDAIRVLHRSYDGWTVLQDAWERYQLPVAVTEVHLGCTREEQLRWVRDAWSACTEASARGVDVRAMTAWALFGSFDWDSLLTRSSNYYEPGGFDVRGPAPRPTALAAQISSLVEQSSSAHPTTHSKGWWQRAERLHFNRAAAEIATEPVGMPRLPRPLVICGAGTLGRAFAAICTQRGIEHRLIGHAELDICDPVGVEAMLGRVTPWALINAAGYVRVDDAETDRSRCFHANTTGTHVLADALARRNTKFVTFSSDLVFAGRSRRPYVEGDEVGPLNVYGQSKASAEAVLDANPEALCIRTAAFFGYGEPSDYLVQALSALDRKQPFAAMDDVLVSPTYLPDLVHASLDLLLDDCTGLWHLANQGAVSWAELAHRAAILTGVNPRCIVHQPQAAFMLPALRPQYSALGSIRGNPMPTLDDALERFAMKIREPAMPHRRLRKFA